MDNDTLRKVQLVQLELAKEFKRVCKKLGILYILDCGTLLGAVRHHGFIPWDDDLDIGMTRENYERFLKEAPAILSEKYYLQTWHNDPNYGLPYAKLRKKGTVYIEETSNKSNARNGIFIDIFPYNSYPNDEKTRKRQAKIHNIYRRLILAKCNYSPWNASGSKGKTKKLVYLLCRIFLLLVKREKLIERYEDCCKYSGTNNSEYVFASGIVNYGKFVVKRKCFEELAFLQFEDDTFLCPVDYDYYLRKAYGDYMKLPPENERMNRHKIVEVSF